MKKCSFISTLIGRVLAGAAWLAILLAGVHSAQAAMVTQELRGHVNSVHSDGVTLPADLYVGAPFTALLRYDPALPGVVQYWKGQAVGHEFSSDLAGVPILSIAVGGVTFASVSRGRTVVYDFDPPAPGFPDWPIYVGDTIAFEQIPFSSSFDGGSTIERVMSLVFNDPGATALSIISLPDRIDPQLFSWRSITLYFSGAVSNVWPPRQLGYYLDLEIDYVVPEPSSMALLALGGATAILGRFISIAARRRSRSAREVAC